MPKIVAPAPPSKLQKVAAPSRAAAPAKSPSKSPEGGMVQARILRSSPAAVGARKRDLGEIASPTRSVGSSCSDGGAVKRGRVGAIAKRLPPVDEPCTSGAGDFSVEMQKMLETFGSDISKTLSAKKQRLEKLTASSTKTASKRVEDVWTQQQQQRQKLSEDFQKQVTSVLQQWETDLDKGKDNEERLTNLFRQQQKVFQQVRVIQSQRLRTLRELHEQYTKGVEELEKVQMEQQTNIQGELKKEMALLQKRILMDTCNRTTSSQLSVIGCLQQQQEMNNVRKSLTSMLY